MVAANLSDIYRQHLNFFEHPGEMLNKPSSRSKVSAGIIKTWVSVSFSVRNPNPGKSTKCTNKCNLVLR